MTKDELKKAAAVMLAAAEGKEIQYKYNEEWITKPTDKLTFNWWSHTYRVKPNTIKYRLALVHYEHGNDNGTWENKTNVICFNTEDQFKTWNNRFGDNFIRFLTDWIEVEIDNE